MRLTKIGVLILAGLGFPAMMAQAALSLNLSSLPGSTIQFNGHSSTFNINPAGGNQWWITSVEGGAGDALALQGKFSGGPWKYGAISVNGPDQHAAVISPLGTFTLYDGTGGSATGTVNWVDVVTHQYVGGVNGSAAVNITGMTYTPGTTPIVDLQNLVAGGQGSVILTFQYNPGMTLTDLTQNNGPYRTSYSGSLTPFVPESGTLLAGVMILVPLAVSTVRILRRSA